MAFTKQCVILSLLFFISTVFSATVNFNASQEIICLQNIGGCSFSDATIWENNIIPSSEDDVVISGSLLFNSSLYIYISEVNTTINSLLFSNAIVAVNSNCTFELFDLNFGNNSVFTTLADSKVAVVYGDTNMNFNFTDTTLNIDGHFVTTGITYLFGRVNINAAARVYLPNVVYYPVSYNVDPNAFVQFGEIEIPHYAEGMNFDNGLNASALIIGNNATVTVSNFFFVNSLFVDIYATFTLNNAASSIGNTTDSISGQGIITISNSNITIGASGNGIDKFDGSLQISGSDVILRQLSVGDLQIFIDPPSMIAVDNVVLGGSTVLNNIVVSGAGLNVTGNLTVLSSIFVQSSSLEVWPGANFVAISVLLQTGSNLTGNGGDIYVLNPLLISAFSTFKVSANTHFTGNLVNQGLLDLYATLTVQGNVTLSGPSSVHAYLKDSKVPVLSVNGTLAVNGSLQYSFTEKPPLKKSLDYLVAQVGDTGAIVGNFNSPNADALSNSEVHRQLAIVYDDKAISVHYKFAVKDVRWWIWVVIGAAAVIIVLLIAFVAVRCKRRHHDYKPVR